MAINYPRLTPAQLAKMRFKEEKNIATESLGVNQSTFREFVLSKEPSYNTPEGWDRIRTTWSGRCADLRLVELLAQLNHNLTDKQ